MIAAEIILFIVLAALTLAVVYLFFLAAAGFVGKKEYPAGPGTCRFLILIPAHNEENGITQTLDSLARLEPVGTVRTVVIADNCTDKTAVVAAARGVVVLERHDPVRRGKGYALEWALAQLNLDEFDAIAVVDADTLVEPGMLRAMALSLANGYGAVQVSNRVTDDSGTPLAHLQHMASQVENRLFYRARSILHLPVLLRGTGMGIAASVIKAHPWDSHSITEDVDYSVKLLEEGVRIDFSTESGVDSAATSTYAQSRAQKMRWASGTFLLIRQKTLSLVGLGLARRRFDLVELAFSFFLLSRPTLIYLALAAAALSPLAIAGNRLFYAFWALSLAALLIVYLLLGIIYVREKGATTKALLQIPRFAVWHLLLQLKAAFKHRRTDWIRTERK